MKQFFASGRYCDTEDSRIQAIAGEVVARQQLDVDIATGLFRFVRDTVRYAFGPWGVPASETMARGEGCCTNKANLLVALLRAAGIPAAYGVLQVNAQEYFGNIAPPFFKPFVSNQSIHIYAATFLTGRWVRCDPSTDSELSAKTSHFCRQTRLIEWDGMQDALDFLQPQHVYRDLGLRSSIDDLLDKPPRRAQPSTIALLNDYLAFVREQSAFPCAEALIEAYWKRLTPGTGRWTPP